MVEPLIIMPVKDSLETAEQAIRAIVASGHNVCVYDDYSSDENAARLDALQNELGIRVVHIREVLDHPSPNYRWVLNTAQREAIEKGQDLVIIESDVIVKADTIDKLIVESQKSKEKSQLIHPFDVGTLLDQQGVAVRTGHHCAEPLIDTIGVPGTVRVSFGLYNEKADIDAFITALKRTQTMLM